MRFCRVVGVLAGITAAMVFAVPAAAQTGNGAEVVRYDDCDADELVGEYCSAGTAVFQEIYARDGTIRSVVMNNVTHHYTFTGAGDLAGCNDEAKVFYNSRTVIKGISAEQPDGQTHQANVVYVNDISGECSEIPMTAGSARCGRT